jgi:hypothetical protein
VADYKVGFGKPPESGKIRKSEIRNPWGRAGRPERREEKLPEKCSEAEILAANEAEAVAFEGRMITRREFNIRAAYIAALKGKVWAIRLLDRLSVAHTGSHRGVVELPNAGPLDEWNVETALAELAQRDARERKAQKRAEKRKSHRKELATAPLVLRSEAEYFAEIESGTVCVHGRTLTRRELRIHLLGLHAAKGNGAARIVIERIREMSAKANVSNGVLVVPKVDSLAEWEAAAGRQQAKFRSSVREGCD